MVMVMMQINVEANRNTYKQCLRAQQRLQMKVAGASYFEYIFPSLCISFKTPLMHEGFYGVREPSRLTARDYLAEWGGNLLVGHWWEHMHEQGCTHSIFGMAYYLVEPELVTCPRNPG